MVPTLLLLTALTISISTDNLGPPAPRRDLPVPQKSVATASQPAASASNSAKEVERKTEKGTQKKEPPKEEVKKPAKGQEQSNGDARAKKPVPNKEEEEEEEPPKKSEKKEGEAAKETRKEPSEGEAESGGAVRETKRKGLGADGGESLTRKTPPKAGNPNTLFGIATANAYIGMEAYTADFNKYTKMFQLLAKLVGHVGFKTPIQRIQDYFFQDFFARNDDLDDKIPAIIEDVKSLAQSSKYDEKFETNIYGVANNNVASKVLVSGARGSNGYRQQYVSSIALIEANEGTSSGLSMAYVLLYPDGTQRTEAKVTNYPISSVREGGKYVITLAEGQKQQFGRGNKIVAQTKIYRLVAGKRYLHYVEYTMVASAATAPTGVKSCSVSFVRNILVTDDFSAKNTTSGFVSYNDANIKNTNSTHYGYFIVDSDDVGALKTTAGLASAGDNVLKTETRYKEKSFEKK